MFHNITRLFILISWAVSLVFARTSSRDVRTRRFFSPDLQAFTGPFDGFERLASYDSRRCVHKPGLPLCRKQGSSSSHYSPADRSRSTSSRRGRPTTRSLSVRGGGESTLGYPIVRERIAWESRYGNIAIFERHVDMPLRGSDGGGGGDGGGDGGGGNDGAGDGPPDSNIVGMGLPAPAAADTSGRRTVEWHVVGSPRSNFSSVVVFPYDTRSRSCTLLREYCPGSNAVLSSLPGGMFEPTRHHSILHAARDELSEEAELTGGTWVDLAPSGIPQDKYSMNRLHAFLAIDCSIDPDPRPRDEEEHILVEHGVTVEEVLRRIAAGDMAAPGAMAAMLAVERLREMGLR